MSILKSEQILPILYFYSFMSYFAQYEQPGDVGCTVWQPCMLLAHVLCHARVLLWQMVKRGELPEPTTATHLEVGFGVPFKRFRLRTLSPSDCSPVTRADSSFALWTVSSIIWCLWYPIGRSAGRGCGRRLPTCCMPAAVVRSCTFLT